VTGVGHDLVTLATINRHSNADPIRLTIGTIMTFII
jgi:hypothetical protein